MRISCLSFACLVLLSCGQASADNQREAIRAILDPCQEGASSRELAQCLQGRTQALIPELEDARARELQNVITACKNMGLSDEALFKDEVSCMVTGIAYVADGRKVRDYVLKMCSQRSFACHAQCLFAIADLTDDEALKAEINSCRAISVLEKRSQCLIDRLVWLLDRSIQSPLIPWWWN